MKNSSDTIGNRTRDLLACSAVPQPTALPRDPVSLMNKLKIQATLWLRQFVAGFSPRRLGFGPGPVPFHICGWQSGNGIDFVCSNSVLLCSTFQWVFLTCLNFRLALKRKSRYWLVNLWTKQYSSGNHKHWNQNYNTRYVFFVNLGYLVSAALVTVFKTCTVPNFFIKVRAVLHSM